MLRYAYGLCIGAAVGLTAVVGWAQSPPQSPAAAEIASCLCLKATVEALGSEMAAKQRAYDDLHQTLDQASADLEAARPKVDVNNPESVSRFRQLLERRDELFKRSTGAVVADLRQSVERYNARTGEYNSRCADRPMDPELLAQVQATLSCPAPH